MSCLFLTEVLSSLLNSVLLSSWCLAVHLVVLSTKCALYGRLGLRNHNPFNCDSILQRLQRRKIIIDRNILKQTHAKNTVELRFLLLFFCFFSSKEGPWYKASVCIVNCSYKPECGHTMMCSPLAIKKVFFCLFIGNFGIYHKRKSSRATIFCI